MAKKTSTKSKTSSKTKTISEGRSSAKTAKVTSASSASKTKPSTKKTVKPKTAATTTASASKPKTSAKAAETKTRSSSKTSKSAVATKPAAEETNRFKINYSQTESLGDRDPLPEEELRKIKSGLSKKDLAAFRELLMQKRAELKGDVESLKADAKNIGASISYEHMADTGSDNYEQEFTLGLVESERQMLHEIDDALIRIEKGIYGICMVTGQPINRARLEAKPWAKYCIEVAREKERRHAIPRFRA